MKLQSCAYMLDGSEKWSVHESKTNLVEKEVAHNIGLGIILNMPNIDFVMIFNSLGECIYQEKKVVFKSAWSEGYKQLGEILKRQGPRTFVAKPESLGYTKETITEIGKIELL